MAPLSATVRAWLAQPAARLRLGLGFGILLGLFVAYQAGQMRAGYNALSASMTERRLSSELSQLRAEHRRASEELARLQTDTEVNRQAYAQVEQRLAELQDTLIDQQEEVAFYRGIVGGRALGALRIQDYALAPSGADAVRLRFVLAQSGPDQREVRGQLQVRIEGQRGGQPVSLDAANASVGNVPRTFRLRYFQDVSAELRLPADFLPERVIIRTVPANASLKPGVESFPWSIRGG